jgi:hypothetical protein
MHLSALHQNQIQIIGAIRSAMRILQMTEHLSIICSLARYIGGAEKLPGDIDVFIEQPLCERYWDFIEILNLHGVISVYDVLDRPPFTWRYCRSSIAHVKALTVDCSTNALAGAGVAGFKHANLDICFTAANLRHIPSSDRWVELLDLHDPNIAGAARVQAIADGHQKFLNALQSAERNLSSPIMAGEIGLYYRLHC